MIHHLPSSFSHGPWQAVLWLGLLAGVATPQVSAGPPAPVAPILSAATRFTDNGNGTVTDGLTGLIWLKNANCISATTSPLAVRRADELASPRPACSLSDGSTAGQWRLPNRNELQSLIDYSTIEPALPVSHPFQNVKSLELDSYYWSSTTYAGDANYAWRVHLYDGEVQFDDKTSYMYVWPVRDGP